ncbi:nucleotidyltransferase domain-containing protein [Candidatus Woesearchaeota archaeon]|nr:nucleotidyltransferase domain-containing protein [Candidatus Woesearchaeota archaeon]
MLQKCSILRTAEIFFKEPTRAHYLIEISKKSGLAHTSTKKNLLRLKELSIVKESLEKKGRRGFPIFNADMDSKEYKKYKRVYNFLQIEESGLADFLKNKLMPKSIVVFGSYSRGEDIEDSDIDIFVECNKEEIDTSRFTRMLNRKIELHFKENFKEYPKELKNNIVNGIPLRGYLEACR